MLEVLNIEREKNRSSQWAQSSKKRGSFGVGKNLISNWTDENQSVHDIHYWSIYVYACLTCMEYTILKYVKKINSLNMRV